MVDIAFLVGMLVFVGSCVVLARAKVRRRSLLPTVITDDGQAVVPTDSTAHQHMVALLAKTSPYKFYRNTVTQQVRVAKLSHHTALRALDRRLGQIEDGRSWPVTLNEIEAMIRNAYEIDPSLEFRSLEEADRICQAHLAQKAYQDAVWKGWENAEEIPFQPETR